MDSIIALIAPHGNDWLLPKSTYHVTTRLDEMTRLFPFTVVYAELLTASAHLEALCDADRREEGNDVGGGVGEERKGLEFSATTVNYATTIVSFFLSFFIY